ncbi:MAG: [FeFe] hydrogenase H-cluster radical SAM maturase HydE [Verrucomicrobiota bacterium]
MKQRVLCWLRAKGTALQSLFSEADRIRREYVGDAVYLRGLIEFSNICRQSCTYCGINRANKAVQRYRMKPEEIVNQCGRALEQGCTTVVLQSGEDLWFDCERLCKIIRDIKRKYPLAITLSVGERPLEELQEMHRAGADRYLLRFETSNPELFARLRPGTLLQERLACFEAIRGAGFQTGSGFLIGLPGADLEVIARDIVFATRLRLDMIGCGPFIAHPDTILADKPLLADREIYFKTIAILRLLNPRAHIPSTTAFDAMAPGSRERLLTLGANVIMPNLTPARYRRLYALYPNKPHVDEPVSSCGAQLRRRLRALKRPIGTDFGHGWSANHNNNS